MRFPDPFACVNKEAFHQAIWPLVFFVGTLRDPDPVPVRNGEAYRSDVQETIDWYPGRKEVIKCLYHQHDKAIAFLLRLLVVGLGQVLTKSL